MGVIDFIHLSSVEENVLFHITRTMLQLLNFKVLFGGLDHEDPHEHIQKKLMIAGYSPSRIYPKIWTD